MLIRINGDTLVYFRANEVEGERCVCRQSPSSIQSALRMHIDTTT